MLLCLEYMEALERAGEGAVVVVTVFNEEAQASFNPVANTPSDAKVPCRTLLVRKYSMHTHVFENPMSPSIRKLASFVLLSVLLDKH